MKYQKIINLLDTTSDNVPKFITKKWVEVHDQSNKIYNTNKQIRFKHQCNNQIYAITAMHIFLSRELFLLENQIIIKMTRN